MTPVHGPRLRRPPAPATRGWLAAALPCLPFVLTVLFTLAPARVVAQQGPDSPDYPRLRAWRMAMDLHVPGEADASALDVASWPPGQLDVALATLRDTVKRLQRSRGRWHEVERRAASAGGEGLVKWLGLTPDEMSRGDASRILERAAVLHSDIAILVEGREPPPDSLPARQGRTTVVVNDGRFTGYQTASDHWPYTRRLLDEIGEGPRRDAVLRDWYRAAAAHLTATYQYGELRLLLERGRHLLPGDGVLAMMDGVRHQAMASERVQVSLASIVLPPGSWLSVGSRERELREAELAFSEALRLDPGLVEARVRLGRVLADQDRHEASARELRAALEAAREPLLTYFAALFLGEQEAALGRTDEATAAFGRAAALFPRAPSPRLGLSHLARIRGDRAAAFDALRRAVGPSTGSDPDDPWWSFDGLAGRHAEAWFAAIRQTFGRQATP